MENKEIFECQACEDGLGSCIGEGIIKWIKHFFNITDEELK